MDQKSKYMSKVICSRDDPRNKMLFHYGWYMLWNGMALISSTRLGCYDSNVYVNELWWPRCYLHCWESYILWAHKKYWDPLPLDLWQAGYVWFVCSSLSVRVNRSRSKFHIGHIISFDMFSSTYKRLTISSYYLLSKAYLFIWKILWVG